MLKILIIDSSCLVRERLMKMTIDLLQNTALVFQAGDRNNAIKIYDDKSPDIVVLDNKIKDGNGDDLISYIKKRDKNNTVIVISNNVNSYYKDRCLSSGADYFIDKSTEFELMLSLLKSMADNPYRLQTRLNCQNSIAV